MLSAWLYFPFESISDFVRARVIDPSSEYELFGIRLCHSSNNTLKVQRTRQWMLDFEYSVMRVRLTPLAH